MTIISDSYMGIFMPQDISFRIREFMLSKLDFPFVNNREVIGAFYLFGKENGVTSDVEIKAATDIAKRTVEQVEKDIRLYISMPQKMNSKFIRENYNRRSLQIVVDSGAQADVDMRIAGDPAILSDCFAQHIAYHRHSSFFELFQPFRREQLPSSLKQRLDGRMLLLGFNFNKDSLPFKNSLEQFFGWISKN